MENNGQSREIDHNQVIDNNINKGNAIKVDENVIVKEWRCLRRWGITEVR